MDGYSFYASVNLNGLTATNATSFNKNTLITIYNPGDLEITIQYVYWSHVNSSNNCNLYWVQSTQMFSLGGIHIDPISIGYQALSLAQVATGNNVISTVPKLVRPVQISTRDSTSPLLEQAVYISVLPRFAISICTLGKITDLNGSVLTLMWDELAIQPQLVSDGYSGLPQGQLGQ